MRALANAAAAKAVARMLLLEQARLCTKATNTSRSACDKHAFCLWGECWPGWPAARSGCRQRRHALMCATAACTTGCLLPVSARLLRQTDGETKLCTHKVVEITNDFDRAVARHYNYCREVRAQRQLQLACVCVHVRQRAYRQCSTCLCMRAKQVDNASDCEANANATVPAAVANRWRTYAPSAAAVSCELAPRASLIPGLAIVPPRPPAAGVPAG